MATTASANPIRAITAAGNDDEDPDLISPSRIASSPPSSPSSPPCRRAHPSPIPPLAPPMALRATPPSRLPPPVPASSLSAAVSRILASHCGSAVRFHLLIARPSASDFDSWLRSLAAKNLQELVLRPPSDEILPLPPSFLAFRSLRTAELTNCRLPEDGAGGGEVNFPHLGELTLRLASVPSSAALHALLVGCPELASLSLDRVFGCRALRVRSWSLRSLTVSVSLTRRRVQEGGGAELEHLVVEDAPALERLLAHDINWGPSINVTGAELRCVRTLALEMAEPQLKPVADFLKCFPCLETLYVMSHMVVPQSMRILNHEMDDDRIECLHHHLKKVVLKGYRGRKHEMQLASFLVRHASVLQVLKFLCANVCSAKWLTNQKRQLQVDSRASLGAQFVFEKFSKSYIRFLKPASNISLVDPFDT
ncbi:unnamed protein product [Miscanthus lutarioriparius]|uniref:FBD domain-containing protein n=1 Tax=Miscanthus lutarioriparius TaxID=422564 RepID=A0A811NJJ4_9POAL|nr:unnamed protein product [Miscanthus lutarioriparius]